MIKEYTIQDIILDSNFKHSLYVGTFEGTEDPDIEWPHRHNFYSLVWFTKGTGINVIDFEEHQIIPHRLFLVKPNQIHNWSYSHDTKGFIIVCDKHIIDRSLLPLFCLPYIDIEGVLLHFLQNTFKTLIYDYKQNDSLREKIVKTGINYICIHLYRTHQSNQCLEPENKIIVQFSEIITQTLSKNITTKEYADRLSISPEFLTSTCKKRCGKSPKAFILELKITEAKRLLYFSEDSIKEISFKLGFEDNSYFARIFKQKVGISPSLFREQKYL